MADADRDVLLQIAASEDSVFNIQAGPGCGKTHTFLSLANAPSATAPGLIHYVACPSRKLRDEVLQAAVARILPTGQAADSTEDSDKLMAHLRALFEAEFANEIHQLKDTCRGI